MNDRKEVLEALKSLRVGSELYFNMHQGGGAMADRIDDETYDLYELPLFGGIEQFYGRFAYRGLPDLVDIGFDEFI